MPFALFLFLATSSVPQDPETIGKIADLVESHSEDEKLNKNLMRTIGLPDERFPVKQQGIWVKDRYRTFFNVGVHDGRRVIILFNRNDVEGWLYRAGPDGKLEAAVHATKSAAPTPIPVDEAEDGYKKGMEFWTARLPYVECLCRLAKRHNQGDAHGVIETASEALQAYGMNGSVYVERGYAHYDLGHWADAMADFDKACELNQDADYAALRAWIIRARLGNKELAKQKLEEFHTLRPPGKTSNWYQQLVAYHLGQLTAPGLIEAAKTSDEYTTRSQQCEAYFYIAAHELVDGNKSAAREYFNKCQATGLTTFREYSSAVAELKLLGN